jgi:hypothetical protein
VRIPAEPVPPMGRGVRDEVWNPNQVHISAELTPSMGRIVCDKVCPVSVSAGRVGAHQRKAGSARHLILERSTTRPLPENGTSISYPAPSLPDLRLTYLTLLCIVLLCTQEIGFVSVVRGVRSWRSTRI